MVELRINGRVYGIVDLYNKVATQLGFDCKGCGYDCTKINVSENIADQIRSTYEDPGAFGMDWLIYGPKVDSDLEDNVVALDTGFLTRS